MIAWRSCAGAWLMMLALTAGAAAASPLQSAAPPGGSFDAIRRRADEARAAGRLEEAIELYGRAVRIRPGWVEGYWYLGTASYEIERYPACRDAFRTVVRLQQTNGAAWAFKGLCEYRVTQYAAALADLDAAFRTGIGDPKLAAVARYHHGLLLTRFEQYERALQAYGEFAREGNGSPAIVEGMGLAVLRLAYLPGELPEEKRGVVQLAGDASFVAASRVTAAAQKQFEDLVTRYPDTPNVHYLYGVYLLRDRPEQALDEFREELRVSPDHDRAMQQLAQEALKRGELETALSWGTRAAESAPRSYVGRRLLGQIKLELNDIDGAVSELEAAVQLEPASPSVRYSLARAYHRAGRAADAARERAEFSRLQRLRQEQVSDGTGPPK